MRRVIHVFYAEMSLCLPHEEKRGTLPYRIKLNHQARLLDMDSRLYYSVIVNFSVGASDLAVKAAVSRGSFFGRCVFVIRELSHESYVSGEKNVGIFVYFADRRQP